MANITRKGQQEQEQGGLMREPSMGIWDPFRMMRDLMRWDPFSGMGAMGGGERMFVPNIDVKETKDALVFRADLPGVKESDVDVSVTGNRLTISGKREEEKEEKEERFYAYERNYGSFSRSFVLPEGVDMEKIEASLDNGVLCLRVPKKAEMTSKRIQLGKQAAEGGAQPAQETGKKAA